jgi:hypothetical protein
MTDDDEENNQEQNVVNGHMQQQENGDMFDEDHEQEHQHFPANQWIIQPGNVLLGNDPWPSMIRSTCNGLIQAVRHSWIEEEDDQPINFMNSTVYEPYTYECMRMEPMYFSKEIEENSPIGYSVPLTFEDIDAFWRMANEQLNKILEKNDIYSLSIGLHRRIAFRDSDGSIGTHARWAWGLTLTWCWKAREKPHEHKRQRIV